MTRRVRSFVVSVSLMVPFTLHPAPCTLHGEVTNRIVAIVNEDVITQGDVDVQTSLLLDRESLPALGDEQKGQMRRLVLQRLIEERLILQEAKRLGLAVRPEEIEERLKHLRMQADSEEAFLAHLAQAGLSIDQLKRKLREQLLIQLAIRQEVRSKIVVSPHEVEQALLARQSEQGDGEQLLARYLLVRVTPTLDPEEAEALAEGLSRQLREGSEIETLSAQAGDPPLWSSGVMEWVSPGELVPELDEVVFRLGVGEVSAPIGTRLGFYVVKVLNRRSRPPADSQEIRRRVEYARYQEKFEQLMSRWVEGLKRQAYIELLD